MCLLNLHESERCKPAAWIPVGWLPNYIDVRAKGLRPGQGYESIPARKMRLFHRCWIEFLDGWAERTRDAMILTWADGVQRTSRIFLGGLLGDQQEGDKFTGEPCVCHRCFAARKDYLVSDAPAQAKSSKRMRLKVEAAAAGAHLKGARNKWVIKWDPDGRNVRPGPGIQNNANNYNNTNNLSSLQYNTTSSLGCNDRCIQVQCTTSLSGRRRGHIFFSTHFGSFRISVST